MGGDKDFFITDNDKEWVHQCFEWIIKPYGYPSPGFTPILFNDQFFPLTIAHKDTAIEPLLTDLCNIFEIDSARVSFQLEEDIRDTHGTPYEIHGEPFECELEYIKQDDGYHYKFHFAKSILKNPKRILFNAVFQFIQIRLSETDIEWLGNQEHYFHFYLIGIYTGWGVLLAQTMIDIGRENAGFWVRTWKFISPMPIPVMAYSLALHSSMIEEKDPSWKKFLPAEIRKQYEKAVDFINRNPNPVFSKQELTAKTLFEEAFKLSYQNDFEKAIETYQKAIFLTNDEGLKATIYNNTGYTFLLQGEFRKSISSFQKALEINPNASYVNENLSFAFIMLGDTDTGKYYHTLGLQTGKGIKAYSYRNLALYHQKRGEHEKAKENFIKAFEHITIPVDWLEYLYARFLFEQGETEESLIYLQMAVEKGEPRAIEWMNELSGAI